MRENIERNESAEEREIEINIGELLKAYRNNILLILIVPLILGILFFIANKFFVKPVYEARSTIIIGRTENTNKTGQDNITYNEVLTNQKLVPTYSEIAKSKNALTQVIKN